MTKNRDIGSDVILWRGHKCTRKDRAFVLSLEKVIGTLTIFQMGGRTDVDASGQTHARYNVIDYAPRGCTYRYAAHKDRDLGGTGWHRTPAQGFDEHIHTVIGPGGSASFDAREQWENYLEGGDGLWPLIHHDDPDDYRPRPQVTFSYSQYRRNHRLRERIADFTTKIQTLRARRKRARKQIQRPTRRLS